MQLVITPAGVVRCIYSELVDLAAFGTPEIRRASHVEPDDTGNWIADLAPVGGPKLGTFSSRSQALVAEAQWLEANWLNDASSR